MKKYQVTAIILTYNPDLCKLKRTIYSFLKQKDIRLQIILSDDGSKQNYYTEAEKLLKQNGFTDYRLLSSEKNAGTVENIYKALPYAEGEYIKLLSPGDYLYQDDTMKRWYDKAKEDNARLSFGDAIHYFEDDCGLHYAKKITHPMYMDIYRHNPSIDQVRYHYLAIPDITTGATILCQTDLMKQYMALVIGKVIYAEDHIYRIMHLDGIAQSYCGFPVIWYETNIGVSSGKSKKWAKLLNDDLLSANEIMIRREPLDNLSKKCQKELARKKDGKVMRKVRRYMAFPELLWKKFGEPEESIQSADETFFQNVREWSEER